MTMTRAQWLRGRPTMTRRDVAALLKVHQDSVSRLLSDGLGYAVLNWGGRGKLMIFDRGLVERWAFAYRCPRRPYCCCDPLLEDARNVAEHLLEERHGYGECEECFAPWLRLSPCADAGREKRA